MMYVEGVNSVAGINWSVGNSQVTRSVLARGGQPANSQGLSVIVNNCSPLPPLREHSSNRNNRIGVVAISGDQLY